MSQVEKSVENIKWAGQNYSKEYRVDDELTGKFLSEKYLFDKWINRGIQENKEAIAGLEKLKKEGTYTELNISEAFRETILIFQSKNTGKHYIHSLYSAEATKATGVGSFYSDGDRMCNVSSAMMNLNSLYPKEFKQMEIDFKNKVDSVKKINGKKVTTGINKAMADLKTERDAILSCTRSGNFCEDSQKKFPGVDIEARNKSKKVNGAWDWESIPEVIWVYEQMVAFPKFGGNCVGADGYLYAECQQRAVTKFLKDYGYIGDQVNTYVIASSLTDYEANQNLLYNILSKEKNLFAYVGNYYTSSGHVVTAYGSAVDKNGVKAFIINDPYGSIKLDENNRSFYPRENKESGLANVRAIDTLAHARSGVHFATMPYFMLYAKCSGDEKKCKPYIEGLVKSINEGYGQTLILEHKFNYLQIGGN